MACGTEGAWASTVGSGDGAGPGLGCGTTGGAGVGSAGTAAATATEPGSAATAAPHVAGTVTPTFAERLPAASTASTSMRWPSQLRPPTVPDVVVVLPT
jgi:hypothetical protein